MTTPRRGASSKIDFNSLIENETYAADVVDIAKADAWALRHMTLVRFYAEGIATFSVPVIALCLVIWSPDQDLKTLAKGVLVASVSGFTGYKIGTRGSTS